MVFAQASTITGTVVDAVNDHPLSEVKAWLEGTANLEETAETGEFLFTVDLPPGQYIISFSRYGYVTARYPIVIDAAETRDLGVVQLRPDVVQEQRIIGLIALGDHELDEEGDFQNISGLLQASRDVFLNAAAFDFSPAFFRPRGLDNQYGKVLINDLEMNKLYDGRPQWSNWGGLNDVQRNQVFSPGHSTSEVSFGGPAGTTNITMKAAQYSKGGRFSYAVANRTYTGRLMGSYHSGLKENGWAYSLSLARRFAEESLREGTVYDANSIFVSVEKKIAATHSLNFTGIYTPSSRGKTSAMTAEVYELKGNRYNSYWGYQDGEIRNSRLRIIEEPIFMLNHVWEIFPRTTLSTNLAYQFGRSAQTRLDYGGSRTITSDDGTTFFLGGGANPDPAYYQKMPSYFFRFENNLQYMAAYFAQKEFIEDGQIDWDAMYASNQLLTERGGNALYVLYEDRNDDRQITANSVLRSALTEELVLEAVVSVRRLNSENYARVIDLLGGMAYLDVDSFSEGDAAQHDLQNPNRLVREGERFKYHFDLHAAIAEGFSQIRLQKRNFDLYTALSFSGSRYQRTGFYKNGNFPESSLGRSPEMAFFNYGLKSGITYKPSGKHFVELCGSGFTKAPSLRNSFSNSRQNNDVVVDLRSERAISGEASYIFRSPWFRSRMTGYYLGFQDATEISFYYADGLSGLGTNATTAFVQEVLSGIDKRHLGFELGMEAQATSEIKFKAVAAVGEYIYSNNPNLYLTSDDFEQPLQYGASYLKNYRLPGGPQRAYQLAFEYRDPSFWWFSASSNFFSHAFLDIAPLTRTRNFFSDADGLPFVGYDENTARGLLKQEQLQNYMLVHMVGGKSWRIKQYFVGTFASVNNLLNASYKTGGYEQSRSANYYTLKEDMGRDQPIFGPKYWYGKDTTYYAHVYVRF